MDPFIGEIRMFAGNFAPRGWAFCNGQLLPINQNQALFSILGTTYGGDGRVNFGLPNLQARIPVHAGLGPGLSNVTLGQRGGAETVTLLASNLPSHSHAVPVSAGAATAVDPVGAALGATAAEPTYVQAPVDAAMNAAAVSPAGGNQPHTNLQPTLAVSFIIALVGIFPARN